MSNREPKASEPDFAAMQGEMDRLNQEIVRLNKVVNALMDRAESGSRTKISEYNAFRTAILLEDQVSRRTEELRAAIHEKEELLVALSESEAKFRSIVYQPIAGICIIERMGERFTLTFANPKFAEIFGYTVDELLALPSYAIVHEPDRAMVREKLIRRFFETSCEDDYLFHGLRKDGSIIDVECHGSIMNRGGQTVLFSMIRDVSERVRAEKAIQDLQKQLREQAIRDPLTGLFNRMPLNEFFDREISRACRHGSPLSVIMGDLDHFKKVNDTYGHLVGDEALKHVAEMIRSVFRASDIFCRYGGEEFLILLPDTPACVAVERAEWLREVLSDQPLHCGEHVVHLTASFGLAVYPQDGSNRQHLIASADRALYEAKNMGRNRVQRAS